MQPVNRQRCGLSRSSRGFTLLEQLVIVIIIGILAAAATPSLLTWKANYELNAAIDQAAQSILSLQRESVRLSPCPDPSISQTNGICQDNAIKGCRASIGSSLFIDNYSRPTAGIKSLNCPMANLRFDYGINIEPYPATTFTPFNGENNIMFSSIGSIVLSNTGKLVLSKSHASIQRCLVISKPIGLIRTGAWDGKECE